MIKIIRPGTTTKEIECKECNVLLSYCKSDIKASWEHYLGYTYQTKYIYCLECGSKIMVSPSEEDHYEMLKNWKLNNGFF